MGRIPQFSAADAARIASDRFGVEATAAPLPSYIDQNFLLSGTDRPRLVLKIAHSAESSSALEMQRLAMARLADDEPCAAQAPQVLPTSDGAWTASEAGRTGEVHLVRLCSYVPGEVLALVDKTPELLRQMGRFLGILTRRLEGFWHPAAASELEWDLRHAGRVVPGVVDCVNDPARRQLVAEVLARFAQHVTPALVSLRSSVIHGDANDHNLIVTTKAERRCVSAIIDFADLVHTHTICELAIAAAYGIHGCDDPLAALAEITAGYHQEFALTDQELAVLFDLTRARIATSVCMSARQRQLDPGNEYLAVSEEPGWIALEQLASVDPEVACAELRRACGLPGADPGATGMSDRLARVDPERFLVVRKRHLSSALSLAYKEPLVMVRGWMQYLHDAQGRRFLDCVNNVCHVGHCHPRVVAAAAEQMAMLNTNSRYLHPLRTHYVERLAATFPEPLSVVFLVCSGSEANDLALRLARAHTGGQDVVVLEGAYHGHTQSTVELSPYKMHGPGGSGLPDHVHEVPIPDPYRGRYRGPGAEVCESYAGHMQETFAAIATDGRRPAAFMVESLLGCGGQVVLPEGYLRRTFAISRAAGAVCIADEVQVGFGRVGSHTWGFETQGVVPDIVTLGKPMGNGHPMAAAVTTPEIARSFETGMEYFNTFGGNPVSCAIGLAVLDVLEEEQLQRHAAEVGDHLRRGLQALAESQPLVGDVRGLGLFLGVELVTDRVTLEPATREAATIVEHLKAQGILISTDGRDANVLKIKPPLPFTVTNADQLVVALDRALRSV